MLNIISIGILNELLNYLGHVTQQKTDEKYFGAF